MSATVQARPGRVYFVVWAAGGDVLLTIDDPGSDQILSIPLVPSNAVPDVLPLLDPVFAHYVAQWEKVASPGTGLPSGFWIEASGLPSRMVSPGAAPRLTALVRRHAPPVAGAGVGFASLHHAAVAAEMAGISRYIWE